MIPMGVYINRKDKKKIRFYRCRNCRTIFYAYHDQNKSGYYPKCPNPDCTKVIDYADHISELSYRLIRAYRDIKEEIQYKFK